MAIRVDTFQLAVGALQDLHIAQGEDRRYSFTFTPAGGNPIDFSGMQDARMTVKDRQGLEIFTREADVLGSDPHVLSFTAGQADTADQPVQPDRVTISYVDALGNKTQLLAKSRFFIDESEDEPGDVVTMPPAVVGPWGIRGRAPFVAAGATFFDVVFPNAFAFVGPYSIELTVFNGDGTMEMITANATLRPGDPGPAPAATGFRIQVSIDFDGFISWRAYQ